VAVIGEVRTVHTLGTDPELVHDPDALSADVVGVPGSPTSTRASRPSRVTSRWPVAEPRWTS